MLFISIVAMAIAIHPNLFETELLKFQNKNTKNGIKLENDHTIIIAASDIPGKIDGKVEFYKNVFKVITNAEEVQFSDAPQSFKIILKSKDDANWATEEINKYLSVCKQSTILLKNAKENLIKSNFNNKLSDEEIVKLKLDYGENWLEKASEVFKTR